MSTNFRNVEHYHYFSRNQIKLSWLRFIIFALSAINWLHFSFRCKTKIKILLKSKKLFWVFSRKTFSFVLLFCKKKIKLISKKSSSVKRFSFQAVGQALHLNYFLFQTRNELRKYLEANKERKSIFNSKFLVKYVSTFRLFSSSHVIFCRNKYISFLQGK